MIFSIPSLSLKKTMPEATPVMVIRYWYTKTLLAPMREMPVCQAEKAKAEAKMRPVLAALVMLTPKVKAVWPTPRGNPSPLSEEDPSV
jgi:hypothetical protein